MRTVQSYAVMFVLMVIMQGCAQLGVPSPESFNQKAAVAIATVTAVRTTATNLLVAKKISPEDAQQVQSGADNARAGVEIARILSKSNMAAADNKLQSVTVALNALNAYLAARSK